MKLRVNANQDVHHLTQKSSSILQITPFKLKHVINFNFKMYMSSYKNQRLRHCDT